MDSVKKLEKADMLAPLIGFIFAFVGKMHLDSIMLYMVVYAAYFLPLGYGDQAEEIRRDHLVLI